MALLTTLQYANSRRARGLSGGTPKAVRAAIASRRIKAVSVDPVMVDSEAADRAWRANTDRSRLVPMALADKRAAAKAGGVALLPQSGGVAGVAPGVEFVEREDRDDARLRKARAAADLAEFRRDLAAGILLVAADVERSWVGAARAFRDALLAIPDRIADELGGLDNADDCRALLESEIQRALSQLSDEPPEYRTQARRRLR